MSWQCDSCNEANLDCFKAMRCVAGEEFGPAGFDGRHLVDELHPNGRCTCWGEGRCAWCMGGAGTLHEPRVSVDKASEKCALEAWRELESIAEWNDVDDIEAELGRDEP